LKGVVEEGDGREDKDRDRDEETIDKADAESTTRDETTEGERPAGHLLFPNGVRKATNLS
jgi:hypothetical protein